MDARKKENSPPDYMHPLRLEDGLAQILAVDLVRCTSNDDGEGSMHRHLGHADRGRVQDRDGT